MMEEQRGKIADFYYACCDMVDTKLILADAKISKILKTISVSSELISAVGETLINFNFDIEFSKAQIKNESTTFYFQLPADREKTIALIFQMLSAFDTHQLDLHSFIKDFFVTEVENMSIGFTNFVYTIILPFRDALCEKIGFSEPKEKEDIGVDKMENNEDKDFLGDFFDDITVILTQIRESVNIDPKIKSDRRDELNITIDALMQSIELYNLKIMNALMISLNYLLQPIKSVRFYNMELQERLATFYSEL